MAKAEIRAIEALEQDPAFLRALISSSVAGIYVYDLQRELNIYHNERFTKLIGRDLREMGALSAEQFFELFHPDD